MDKEFEFFIKEKTYPIKCDYKKSIEEIISQGEYDKLIYDLKYATCDDDSFYKVIKSIDLDIRYTLPAQSAGTERIELKLINVVNRMKNDELNKLKNKLNYGNLRLIRVNAATSVNSILEMLKERGLRSANARELLCFGAQYQNARKEKTIVSLKNRGMNNIRCITPPDPFKDSYETHCCYYNITLGNTFAESEVELSFFDENNGFFDVYYAARAATKIE